MSSARKSNISSAEKRTKTTTKRVVINESLNQTIGPSKAKDNNFDTDDVLLLKVPKEISDKEIAERIGKPDTSPLKDVTTSSTTNLNPKTLQLVYNNPNNYSCAKSNTDNVTRPTSSQLQVESVSKKSTPRIDNRENEVVQATTLKMEQLPSTSKSKVKNTVNTGESEKIDLVDDEVHEKSIVQGPVAECKIKESTFEADMNEVPSAKIAEPADNTKPGTSKGKTADDKISRWKDMPKLENPKWKDLMILQVSPSLTEHLCNGGLKISSMDNIKSVTVNYLVEHPSALTNLIRLAEITKISLTLFSSAVKCIHQILILSSLLKENDGKVFNVADYIKPLDFLTLINCLTTVPNRFPEQGSFSRSLSVDLYAMLVKIVNGLCRFGQFQNQMKRLSKNTVQFLCHLLRRKLTIEMVIDLLEILRLICKHNSENCNFLYSKDFYDNLHSSYVFTEKLIPVVNILQVIAQNKPAMDCLSKQEKMIDILLKMISHRIKPLFGRRTVINILNKIADNAKGLEILFKPGNYQRLHNYFTQCKENDEYNCRMGVFSILVRCQNTVILENTKLDLDLQLPQVVSQQLNRDILDNEGDSDSDSDQDNASEVSDEYSSDDSSASQEYINSAGIPIDARSSQRMLKYFSEYFSDSLSNNNQLNEFRIFSSTRDSSTIQKCITRAPHQVGVAFPDAAMLAPESDEYFVQVPKFPLEYLSQKLKDLRNNVKSNFSPRIVFDLDELVSTFNEAIIPRPSTYILSDDTNYVHLNSNNLEQVSSDDIIQFNSLKFESRFECGNLRKAIQIDEFEYNLILSPDTHTVECYHWFYFQVSGMSAGQEYVFNIINLIKNCDAYNEGMLPVVFSVKGYSLYKTGWRRVGNKIVFHGDRYTNADKSIQFKTLTFHMTFPYNCDYVYIAKHYPYTYSRLMSILAPCIHLISSRIYIRLDKLCNTVNNANEVPVLTVTAGLDHDRSLHIPFQKRPIIFLTARIHPGETNASWVMEGVIQYLLSETEIYAAIAREYFVFKIIPMINIEGVIIGNNRRGITGTKLNQSWIHPSNVVCPELYYIKQLIECAKRESKIQIAAYMDFHGHSGKGLSFFLGCNPRLSWNGKDHQKDLVNTLELIPRAIKNLNPHMQLALCKYSITKAREGTARIVMWRQMGISHSYTLECCMFQGRKRQSVNTKLLTEFGESIVAAFGNIADKIYKSKEALPSLGLDYENMNT